MMICSRLTTTVLAAGLLVSLGAVAQDRPDHPDELVFEDRVLDIPAAADYRFELDGGNVAYIVEDRTLPLVDVWMFSRAGRYVNPAADQGLAALTATMLRDGGTEQLDPAALDERLDFISSDIDFAINAVSASAHVDSLTRNLDESLDLMFDMLTEPRLDEERLAIAKSRQIEALKKRNDDTRQIEPRVWSRILYGDDYFLNQLATGASVEAVDDEAIRSFARQVFASGQLVFAVSGDVDAEDMVARLNRQLARLPQAQPLPPVPDDPEPLPAGVYGVDKPEVNQTRVSIGHPGPARDTPDRDAIQVMNYILGGGGFTSRITSRVRSDEGLAYSAGSYYRLNPHFPGEFRALFQSKNPSVPQATAIVLEEIERIRSEPVSDSELNTAKAGVLAVLNEAFANADARALRFASDDINGEAADYWQTLEDRVEGLDVAAIRRVAETHLQPDQLRILLVGALQQATAGDGSHANLEAVSGQPLQVIPLRDPLTLESSAAQTVAPQQ